MFSEEIFGIMNDADDVLECVGVDPFGMVDVMEGSMSINKITIEEMKDPVAVKALKKQLKSAKKWQTVLNVLVKLNRILAGAGAIGSVAGTSKIINTPDSYDKHVSKTMYWGDDGNPIVRKETSIELSEKSVGNIKALVLIPIISLAVSVLCSLVKKALANKELKDIVTLDAKINSAISLYEKQMTDAGPKEKESLQKSIDALKDLQELSKSERERVDK